MSHANGFQDCPYSHKGVRSTIIDEQISDLIQSLKLPSDWEGEVRKMLRKEAGSDLEIERKEIREKLRRLRAG